MTTRSSLNIDPTWSSVVCSIMDDCPRQPMVSLWHHRQDQPENASKIPKIRHRTVRRLKEEEPLARRTNPHRGSSGTRGMSHATEDGASPGARASPAGDARRNLANWRGESGVRQGSPYYRRARMRSSVGDQSPAPRCWVRASRSPRAGHHRFDGFVRLRRSSTMSNSVSRWLIALPSVFSRTFLNVAHARGWRRT